MTPSNLRSRRLYNAINCRLRLAGGLLERLKEGGVHVFGAEYSTSAVATCHSRGLTVRQFDLTKDNWDGPASFDIVVSTEVAEHLPASSANRYIHLLTSLGDRILFTAATPGQGGNDHVNERPHEFWIEMFKTRGFQFDSDVSLALRAAWASKNVPGWYHRNVMVFLKGTQSTIPLAP